MTHRFTTCDYCKQALNFEDARKRIESGKWAHAKCFSDGGLKPYPVPHQVQNGMKHVGNGNGNGAHASEAVAVADPQGNHGVGILERILAAEIGKMAVSETRVRDLINKELETRVPKPIVVQIVQPNGKKTREIRGAHKQFPKLLKLISYGKHCYLYGAPGSGKSTAAKQCADALEIPFAYSSLNPQTPESRLIGFIHAGGNYVETDFYRLYKGGGVYCLDEMDNASPALLNTLNSLLENGHGSFPCGMVSRHPKFVLVATGNTNGNGANPQFPDRRAFDAAFKERFLCIQWEYDLSMEKTVTLEINPDAESWLNWVRQVRAHIQTNDLRLVASPRASFAGALLLKDKGFSVDEISDMVVFKGLDRDTVDNILRSCPLPKRAA